ncbi:hypothetical protein L8C07_19090 [Paenibacillus sp. CMAA1739]|uniref:hypothetical protein n=1 Tax=Paenibacillus ottowii TaxID=2315729 RepID=UPI0027300EDE|nr:MULTISPECIES: hypothetical protein [Paenibacillus]MDP1510088.1 hypothetical protein [Paenibacillus ottowii]MEC4568055.1 hypothetical protein [Paenibacillus sp. CMAA1739]
MNRLVGDERARWHYRRGGAILLASFSSSKSSDSLLEVKDEIIQRVKNEIDEYFELDALDAFKLILFQLECVQKITEAIAKCNRKIRVNL